MSDFLAIPLVQQFTTLDLLIVILVALDMLVGLLGMQVVKIILRQQYITVLMLAEV